MKLHCTINRFGEVGNAHRPMALDTKKLFNFAFVRYLRKEDAIRAQAEMDGQWLDGRELSVRYVKQTSYYGQDESTELSKDKSKVY